MEVVDTQDHAWFLLAKGRDLFLDVNCSYSAVSYPFLLQLSEDERRRYEDEGRDYLSKLAEEIQNSAPGVVGTQSEYKDRSLHQLHGAEVTQSIRSYLQKRQ